MWEEAVPPCDRCRRPWHVLSASPPPNPPPGLPQRNGCCRAGLLFTYFLVASSCWCLTLVLVPYFEKALLDLNLTAVTAAALTMLTAAYVNFSGPLGLAVHDAYYDKALAYVRRGGAGGGGRGGRSTTGHRGQGGCEVVVVLACVGEPGGGVCRGAATVQRHVPSLPRSGSMAGTCCAAVMCVMS